jgi:thimet oligopeptidase
LAEPLDHADAKLLEVWSDTVMRSGAGLPAAGRTEVQELNHRIDELETAYAANLANDTPTIELTAAQAVGLPADFLAGLTRSAGGGYIVPVSESTDERFLENARDPQAREMYVRAYGNRGYPENLPLLRETLAIRLRLAHLLHAPTWASYVLGDRMAKNPARVDNFLNDLDARLYPLAQKDIQRLTKLKAEELKQPYAALQPWDVAYYHAELMRRDYRIDDDFIRRYFPAQNTINAVLAIYSRLLSVSFEQVIPAHAWSDDVTEYEVSDARNHAFLGTLYLDLYPRPGKYTHFASFPLLPERRREDGTIRPPIDAIVGNWSPSAPGQPALLTHDEVQTFFHEFGHAMATLLAKTPYESLSSGFRTDFVEAPSQMLENWVWDPTVLKQLSRNIDSGLPLPDNIIRDLIASRYVDEAYYTTRQILYADVDMAYHSAHPGDDTTQRWKAIQDRVSPIGFIDGTHPEASFGHIMGGYDAGYYGYLWSKVYAQDMFTAFTTAGLEDPTIGMRYRTTILEPAREIEPDDEVRAFLGRPMNPKAFYDTLNLATPTGSESP